MEPFSDLEIMEHKPKTLDDLALQIELASLEADAEKRVRDAVRALLQYVFDEGVTEAFNRAATGP